MRSRTCAIVLTSLASCATVRLTPTAADYVERNALEEAEAKYKDAQVAYDNALGSIRSILMQLTNVDVNKRKTYALPVDDDELSSLAQSQHEKGLRKARKIAEHALRLHADELILLTKISPVCSEAELAVLKEKARRAEVDYQLVNAAKSGVWEYFVEGALYLSIEPVIAIRPDLEAVAVPSIGVNWRPFHFSDDSLCHQKDADSYSILGALTPLAVQLVLGGALNPSDGGADDSTAGAIGVGFSYPIAGIGAFSAGAVWYGDSDDSHGAPYVSLTLGDFAKKTSTPKSSTPNPK